MPPFKSLFIIIPIAFLGACVVRDRGGPPAAEVSVNPAIAFGYSDGYWDRSHQWHQWRDRQQAEAWQRQNAAHYYDRRHDQDRDTGWRDSDQYWNGR
jgi:hypothetical protein